MNGEDEQLLARMADLERTVARYKTPAYTHFLTMHEAQVVKTHFRPSPFVSLLCWGGHAQCERVLAGVFPDFSEPDAAVFPIAAVRLDGTGDAGHRQILGSVLSLGIAREVLGDIFPFEGFAYLFCEEQMAGYLQTNLERVGRERVRVSVCGPQAIELPERKYKLVEGTVASMRLDCVLSLVTGESRAKIGAYIKGGLVNINWEPAEDPARVLREGDVLSLRHFGRVEVAAIGGETRKGRLHLTMKQYI